MNTGAAESNRTNAYVAFTKQNKRKEDRIGGQNKNVKARSHFPLSLSRKKRSLYFLTNKELFQFIGVACERYFQVTEIM